MKKTFVKIGLAVMLLGGLFAVSNVNKASAAVNEVSQLSGGITTFGDPGDGGRHPVTK